MVVGEQLEVVGEYTTPREAVSGVRQQLSQCFDQLVEAGVHPWQKDGKLRIHEAVPVDTEAKIGSRDWKEAYERQRKSASVEGFSLHRSPKTGAITYASIYGEMPAQLSYDESFCGMFRADNWHARMYFPPKHNAQETQRLVVDTWKTPYVHLALAANAMNFGDSPERTAAYKELYKNLCERRDGAGIPLGAVAIERTVIGRDGRSSYRSYLPESEGAKINSLMGDFASGVGLAIDAHRRVA